MPPHPQTQPCLQAFAIKFALTFVSYGIGWQKVRLVMSLMLSAGLSWLYLRWSPHLVAWVNHVRVGLYATILLSAVLAVVLVFPPEVGAGAVVGAWMREWVGGWVLVVGCWWLGAGGSVLVDWHG